MPNELLPVPPKIRPTRKSRRSWTLSESDGESEASQPIPPIAPLVVDLAARVRAHDQTLSEIRSDVREILAATSDTKLAVAVLPTWDNVKERDKELSEALRLISERVKPLEAAALESKGSAKVLVVVAGIVGSCITAVVGWVATAFQAPTLKP